MATDDLSGGILIAVITFRLRAPWAASLKDKRMIVNSLTAASLSA